MNPTLRSAAILQLVDNFETTLTITPVDADQNPTSLPAGVVPVWTNSDPTKVNLTVAPDGLSAVAAGTPSLGTSTIGVSVTNPDGTLLASGALDITTVAGATNSIQITAGTATAQ